MIHIYNTYRTEIFQEPELTTYIHYHNIKKRHDKSVKTTMQSYMSRITRLLADDIQVWQNIPPNWLSRPKILMLSDMIASRDDGNLIHIGDDYQSTCNICHIDITHPTYHWLAECRGYKTQIQELTNNIHGCSNIKEALYSRMHCQRVLRVMAKIALRSDYSHGRIADLTWITVEEMLKPDRLKIYMAHLEFKAPRAFNTMITKFTSIADLMTN